MFDKYELKFVNKEITPFGGLSLFFKMLERSNFDQVLFDSGLPSQGSNRGYSPSSIVKCLFAGVWCGASCFSHLDIVRHDKVLTQIGH